MSNIPGNDAIRLRHMLDAAHKARQFILERERSDLESDEMLALAPVRLLAEDGALGREATHRASIEGCDLYTLYSR